MTARCPHPRKRRFASRAQALAAIADRPYSDANHLYGPIRAYRCKCRFWHLCHSNHYGRRP